jgi:hypothetical protein
MYMATCNAPEKKEMSTLALDQTHAIMQSLQLNKIVSAFHQVLYAKTTEILWKEENFKNNISRRGVFHTTCNLLSIIRKIFQVAGLKGLWLNQVSLQKNQCQG